MDVIIEDDVVLEPLEAFTVTLQSGDLSTVLIGQPSAATISIEDNDGTFYGNDPVSHYAPLLP